MTARQAVDAAIPIDIQSPRRFHPGRTHRGIVQRREAGQGESGN
jgi:hypothetical protein